MRDVVYYIAIKKGTKEAIVTRCRSVVARFLGVTSMTLFRRLRYSNYTYSKNYIVMKNVSFVKSNRGKNLIKEESNQLISK